MSVCVPSSHCMSCAVYTRDMPKSPPAIFGMFRIFQTRKLTAKSRLLMVFLINMTKNASFEPISRLMIQEYVL